MEGGNIHIKKTKFLWFVTAPYKNGKRIIITFTKPMLLQ